jgi:hypothetical protein
VLSYFETRTRIIALVAVGASLAALLLRIGGAAAWPSSRLGDRPGGPRGPGRRGHRAARHRLGPKATGVLQSALGNLPEFFIGIFALRAGLLDVVRAALVGSILANTLLVLGLAFVAGGLRHGPRSSAPTRPR